MRFEKLFLCFTNLDRRGRCSIIMSIINGFIRLRRERIRSMIRRKVKNPPWHTLPGVFLALSCSQRAATDSSTTINSHIRPQALRCSE
jgi:hypothetical protein